VSSAILLCRILFIVVLNIVMLSVHLLSFLMLIVLAKQVNAAVAVACVFVNDNLPMSMQLKGREDTLTSQGKAQYGTLWGQNVRPGILASSICS
jgi:hypothetical protein